MIHFDTFESLLKIEGKIVLQTPLHIGSGNKRLFGSDNEVVKTFDGKPYIPGSSLKGVLRSFIERLAQSKVLVADDYTEPCVIGENGKMCLSEYEKGEKRKELLKKLNNDHEALADYIAEHLCPICHLFGNHLRAGKVRILDAQVNENWFPHYDVRDGVGIDRDTGTAMDRVKYDFEAVPAGTEFQFCLYGENLSDTELRWLITGLEGLKRGYIPVGGKVARGLGRVKGEEWHVQLIDKKDFIVSMINPDMINKEPFDTYVESLLLR